VILGAHTTGEDALREAVSVGAECVQLFLGDPQSWKKPPPRPDADRLRAAAIPVYVHAPYLINVASPNNRIRIPSRKILIQTLQGAAEIGAAGVIVHGGHAEDGVEGGFARWRKLFEELRELACPVPILIENTAGGENAMARRVDVIVELWRRLEEFGPGFCFDTCHAHAAGEDLTDVIPRVLAATGRIDVVHANSSRDAAGSGRDRHTNFTTGEIDPQALWAMVRASGAPTVVCETPWPGIADDLAFLHAKRAALAAEETARAARSGPSPLSPRQGRG
jgi:deoxyribonuclease-4